MFNKIKQKIVNYLKPKYDQSIIVESDRLPFDEVLKPNFYNKDLEDFKNYDFKDCEYEVFKYRDPKNFNEFGYMCVGEARFGDREPQKFIMTITESEIERIVCDEKFKSTFGINFEKKLDLIDQFKRDEIVGHVDYHSFMGNLINYEVNNGVTYKEVFDNIEKVQTRFDSNFYLSFLNKDSEGKTLLDVVEQELPERVNLFKKGGFLFSEQLDSYNDCCKLKDSGALSLANYSFEANRFIGKENGPGFISAKYENCFMIDENHFFISGTKSTLLGDKDFAEIVDSKKAMILLSQEVDVMHDKAFISLNEKVNTLLESGSADWKTIIASDMLKNIGDFPKEIQAEILNHKDFNGETALDVAVRKNYTGEISAFESMGALTTGDLNRFRYKELENGFSSGEFINNNYKFEANIFIKKEESEGVIGYKYENFFKAGVDGFLLSGVKQFEDPNKTEEFVEFVNKKDGIKILMMQPEDSLTVENITFGEKLKILVDNSLDSRYLLVGSMTMEEFCQFSTMDKNFASNWKDLIDNGSIDIIINFNKNNETKVSLFDGKDNNGETLLDVVLKDNNISLADDLMKIGAHTSAEVEVLKEQEKNKENINDNDNEF